MAGLRSIAARLRETAHLMVGLPSYDGYLQHMAVHHPDREVMDRAAFFRNRQSAHYGENGGKRCC